MTTKRKATQARAKAEAKKKQLQAKARSRATAARREREAPPKARGRPPEPHTPLGHYLVDRGVTHEEAAAELELTRVYVSKLVAGQAVPSADVMHRIEQWTRGAVSMQSWFEQ